MSKTGQQPLPSRQTLARTLMANPAPSAPSAPSAPTRRPDDSDVTGDLQYELIAIRGEGPRAKVYRAKEKRTGKLLAIKVWYSMEDPGEELKRRDEAKLEGELLAKIHGLPHLLPVSEIRHWDIPILKVHMPMQYYHYDLSSLMDETETVRGLVSDQIIIPPWYNTVLTQMLEALTFLSRKDIMILHRNINPHNIVYNTIENFVLVGFSHARFGAPVDGKLFHHGGPARSFVYMAPEVFERVEQETPAVDVWAVGVLCLDMLCMVPPVEEGYLGFERMRDLSWRDTMCELAKRINKPEVEMMVVKRVRERAPAGVALEFARTSPSLQRKHYQASEELLFFILKKQGNFNNWSDADLREYAASYIRTFMSGRDQPSPAPPARGSVAEVANPRRQIETEEITAELAMRVIEEGRLAVLRAAQPPPLPGSASTRSVREPEPSGQPPAHPWQPPPPPGPPPTRAGGRPGPSGSAAASPLTSSEDSLNLSRGRALMLQLGAEKDVPGMKAVLSLLIAANSNALAGTSRETARPQRAGSRDLDRTESDRLRPTEAQGRQSPRDPKAGSEQGDVKAKRPPGPPSSRSQRQTQQVEAQASQSSPPSSRRPETQGQQDTTAAKQSSPSPTSRASGETSPERAQLRVGLSREEILTQLAGARVESLSEPRSAQGQREGTQARSGDPPAPGQGRGIPRSREASHSRGEGPGQQSKAPDRPPAPRREAQGQQQQSVQGQRSEGERQQQQSAKERGRRTPGGVSRKTKKRR